MASIPTAYANAVWQQQNELYEKMWYYFSGQVFDEKISDRSEDKKYPLGINLFKTACFNHRAVLFGEYADKVLTFQSEEKTGAAQAAEKAVERGWSDSHRNSLLLEAGLMSPIFGGHVFRIAYDPVRERAFFRLIQPTIFFPVWNDDDYHELLEVFVQYEVDARTAALRFNVDLGDAITANILEHWTQDYYEFTVNGKPAYWDRQHAYPIAGKNDYIDPATGRGIIPFEYFPFDRVGEFYGIPLGKDDMALVDEYNRRMGDMGDAVMDSTHQPMFLVNRPKGKKGLERIDRVGLNDLGMPAPGQKDPNVFSVKGSDIGPTHMAWLELVRDTARSGMFTPAVSYGEDEGSQRSALTLAFRMWPTTSKVRATRGLWNDCFRSLHHKFLIVVATRGGYNVGRERSSVEVATVPQWAVMLPRDREQLVNEIVIRKQAGIISTMRAIQLLESEDTAWIEEEMARIEADKKAEMDQQIRLAGSQMKIQAQNQGRRPGSAPSKSSSQSKE